MTEQRTELQQRFHDALAELPAKRRQFVHEYLKDLNGTKAAIRAGYAEHAADQQASRLLTFVKVDAAVRAGLAVRAMPADEILVRMTDQARGSMEPFLKRNEHGEFTGIDVSENAPVHLIKKATITRRTIKDITTETFKVELYDAHAALVKLGEHHKLWGKSDDILKYIDLGKLTPEQLQRLANGEDPLAVLLAT